jgi:hypothetical protein
MEKTELYPHQKLLLKHLEATNSGKRLFISWSRRCGQNYYNKMLNKLKEGEEIQEKCTVCEKRRQVFNEPQPGLYFCFECYKELKAAELK